MELTESLRNKEFQLIGEEPPYLVYHPASALLVEAEPNTYRALQRIAAGESLAGEPEGMMTTLRRLDDYLARVRDRGNAFDYPTVSRSLLAHHPVSLMLFVTNRCNFACHYCYERSEHKRIEPRDLSVADMKKVVGALFRRSGSRPGLKITFFGGEPLLNFECIEQTVAHSRELAREQKKRIRFSISTNGYLLTDHICQFLVRHRFGVLVSIDGPKEDHDRHRVLADGGGTYDRVAANISKLLRMQLEAKVNPLLLRSTGTADCGLDGDELRDHFRATFPGARIMLGESSSGLNSSSECDVQPLSEEELLDKLDEYERDFLDRPLEWLQIRYAQSVPTWNKTYQALMHSGDTHMPYSICGVCRNSMGVSAEGDYYPCHRYVGLDRHRIGSIGSGLDKSLEERCYADFFAMVDRVCGRCWAHRLCGGPCPASVATPEGGYDEPDPGFCANRRLVFSRFLRLFWLTRGGRPDVFDHFTGCKTPTDGEGDEDLTEYLAI